ncbi:hypothetical protein QMK19_29995 [Streptomyces sp. H10-C2]|uniref:hypothetical protein n=1 Tax=unclassified Streptomyces TaxID=2593676 RepID=UPI0024B9326C|nr:MULTISPECIES: hypothetical protein [unclassified Streptomyces]MDJ0344402.1 hypothetical protein [Streptomyces sp. PH10-H1]MDJ0373771.1 hypothetical protein [Streptomyces sp. H10-C2]
MATRRRITLAAIAAAAALTLPAAAGCSAIDKALDCAHVAATVAGDVQNLQNAVGNAGNSPQDAVNALDQISRDLKDVGSKTGNADVGKAVTDLTTAVQNARTAANKGTTPDITPVADAAGELTKVCTPG